MESSSIEKLFRKHYDSLCLYATHYVGDIDVAEDIVMDCFLKFSAQLTREEKIISEKSYLYQMVRNQSIEYNRKTQNINTTDSLPDIDDDVQELIERSEREARLWKAIDTLPDGCRNVFLLSKRDGLKNREIAEELNISIKTVEAQISKAYRVLRGKAKEIYLLFF